MVLEVKGNYGVDAPKVVRRLFLIGILSVAAGGILFEILDGFSPGVAWTLLWLTMIGAAFCLLEGYLMLRSSRKGKFRVIERLLKELKLKGNEQILDVGCGRGALLIQAAKLLTSGKAIGIDLWREEDLSGNSPFHTTQNIHTEGVDGRAEVETGDVREMGFAEGTFDLVLSCLALHNIAGLAEQRKALREMIRVLRPGGKIGIIDFRHTGECSRYLESKGFTVVHHGPSWQMFPPATTLIAHAPTPP